MRSKQNRAAGCSLNAALPAGAELRGGRDPVHRLLRHRIPETREVVRPLRGEVHVAREVAVRELRAAVQAAGVAAVAAAAGPQLVGLEAHKRQVRPGGRGLAADLLRREQRGDVPALELRRQTILHNVEVPVGLLLARPRPAVADAHVQVRDGAVVLVLLENASEVPARVDGVVEAPDLLLLGDIHGGLQDREVVVGVGRRKDQQDALALAPHELNQRGAVLDATIRDIEHLGGRAADVEVLRGLLYLPKQGRHGEPTDPGREAEEAEPDQEEHDGSAHPNEVLEVPAVPCAHGVLLVVPSDQEPDPDKHPDDAARHSAQTTDEQALVREAEAIHEVLDARGALALEEDVVAPAEVQDLQPEAQGQDVVHAEADGVQAARAGERGALAQAAKVRRLDVAGLLAAGVQGAEGELADDVVVAGRLEVAGRTREDDEGAVGVLRQLAELHVLAVLEVVLREAALVVGVQGGAQLLVEGYDEEARPEGPRDTALIGIVAVGKEPVPVLRDRTVHDVLHKCQDRDQEQRWASQEQGFQEEVLPQDRHDANGERQDNEPEREEQVQRARLEHVLERPRGNVAILRDGRLLGALVGLDLQAVVLEDIALIPSRANKRALVAHAAVVGVDAVDVRALGHFDVLAAEGPAAGRRIRHGLQARHQEEEEHEHRRSDGEALQASVGGMAAKVGGGGRRPAPVLARRQLAVLDEGPQQEADEGQDHQGERRADQLLEGRELVVDFP
eukprot:CAMPEP_0204602116 /NCGR_PEP_ID=MMETSP0661-20131031/56458_1 /ASSEMBLY_ACC=CAM_ASM_000606 /TAXON_ID=109239 /ORGANISM="Alexandrium margalefi, Strain AMGDE01CS-322" /LENGTH=733 /DNA_ID=CAMNT_0051613051 /DNA_START=121 /DNA_END=2318 /DNA_ORIENTATION=+